jgi:hypothetical protein
LFKNTIWQPLRSRAGFYNQRSCHEMKASKKKKRKKEKREKRRQDKKRMQQKL